MDEQRVLAVDLHKETTFIYFLLCLVCFVSLLASNVPNWFDPLLVFRSYMYIATLMQKRHKEVKFRIEKSSFFNV